MNCYYHVLYRSYMHTPQTTRKRYVYFLNQILIFLVLFIVDANVFILLGVGLGDIALNFELVLQNLMKVVVIQRNIAGKLVLPDYLTVF